MNAEVEVELVSFLRAMADPVRLQVAGLLARHAYSLKEVCATLQLKPAVALKHLDLLVHGGWVRESAAVYTWNIESVRALATRTATAPTAPEPPEGTPEYERAVMLAFLNPDGTLREIPVQERKQEVFFRQLLTAFTPGQPYTEKEVNAIIQRLHGDTAYFRRSLIDRGWLKREADGRRYWRPVEA